MIPKAISGILILSATRMEVAGFLEKQEHGKIDFRGFALYQGPCRNGKGLWHCLITGPGVFNTAAGLSAYLSQYTPKLVLDTGIAGVFPDSSLGTGDLAMADQESYAHTGVGENSPLPFDLILGKSSTRTGTYGLNREANAACQRALAATGLPEIPAGPFLTVSAITDTREKADLLYAKGSYLMESMEGAAAAHVCDIFQVPLAEIRAGSNITGERDKSLWDIPLACDMVAQVCLGLTRLELG